MKVGLLDVLGARQMRYWNTFLNELGAEVVTPTLPAEDAYELGRRSLPDVPVQVQLVLGRLLELGNVDLALLPSTRAVSQDAWASDLAELLARRISGLPTLRAVPDGGPELTGAALELGQQLTHNASQVRLALSKVKLLAQPPRESLPPLSAPAKPTVAVIGPDHLLRDAFLTGPLRARLGDLALHPVWADQLPREQVEERGQRFSTPSGKPLPPGERDLWGAQNLLEGKGAVRGLIYLAPLRDAATLSALTRLSASARKPVLLLELAPELSDWPELAAFAARLAAPPQEHPL